jgi:hypothetical protein
MLIHGGYYIISFAATGIIPGGWLQRITTAGFVNIFPFAG